MSLPRYPDYKDSGVPWLGEVPSHWSVAPFKRLVDFQNGSDHKSIEVEDGYPVYGSGGVFAYASEFMHDGESVLLGRKGTVDRPLYVTGKFWTVDTMYWTHIASNACAKFCYYAATSIPFAYYSTNTALPSMTQGALGAHLMAFPKKGEQVEIAGFLDRETAKIDALIAEQEKLLALLAEKRQAIISHAVTRGLDPNAPMKDSGIPWLGAVPAHWGVHSFRRELISSISNGIFKKKDEFGSGALLVNVFDIYRPDFQIEYGGLDRVMCSDAEIDSYRVHAGDLFFVRSSLKVEGIAVAAVAPSCDEPAVYECHLIRARPRANSFNARFASYLFNSDPWRQHFIRSAKITTMTTIDQEAILSTPVLLPPYAEQMEISEFVHSELKRLDATRHSVDGAIVLLRERRNALITAAVTGQIDVRGLAEARTA